MSNSTRTRPSVDWQAHWRTRHDMRDPLHRATDICKWEGTLVSDGHARIIDRHSEAPAQYRIVITPHLELDGLSYMLATEGDSKHSRRYRKCATLDDAIWIAEKWAARRFYWEAR